MAWRFTCREPLLSEFVISACARAISACRFDVLSICGGLVLKPATVNSRWFPFSSFHPPEQSGKYLEHLNLLFRGRGIQRFGKKR
jgi:hypothetical protein